jgi:undecaprenyl-diphosphatase
VTFWQALLLGLLQGATELFPVSSLGHADLIPPLLHWRYRPSDPGFVPFLVLLHLGTAGALLVLYWREWGRIVAGFFRAAFRGRIENADERLAMLLVAGTVPGGAIGALLENQIKSLFATPVVAAAFLIVNGLILLAAEVLRRRDEAARRQDEADYRQAQQLGFRAAVIVGTCQALALVPGISRSGVTMAGGLVAGLRHQEAARFSFLLATPIIGAAGVLEIPQLLARKGPLGEYLLAGLLAALAAYVSARFLLRYFRSGRLDPYGWYCIALGALSLLLLR